MSRLIKIAAWGGTPRASVIFVHGLGGHAYDTWRRDTRRREPPEDVTFWPLWRAEDLDGISVYTLAYEAPASNWLGTSMPLQDRAVNVLEILLSEPGLKAGPIVFICHSLGGLIVKQILLDLQQQKDRRKEAKDLLGRVTQVVFAATPHTGARHATWLDRLRFFAWPSTIARTLVANDPTLRSINVAYRGFADERRDHLQHRVFYETQGTPAGVIVDEASADPGLPGDPPVPVDADHISIVKPIHRFSVLYARTRDFIASNSPIQEAQEGALEICPLPPIQSEQPLNIVPKLIRVAAIGIVGLIAYKGVQGWIAPPPPIEQIQKPLIEQLRVKDIQIADLAKLLVERNPAAGPAAQQAVGAAVTSIAQGAEEGDKRLETALALLKDNKIVEASKLLKEVAEAKTAHAEQAAQQAEKATAQADKDRKAAAVAYRNLGAIAGLADPKRALEAYEKALALDPDDIESLFWAGYIQIDYGDLNKAQEWLERALNLAQGSKHEVYRYRAVADLGRIKELHGDLTGALKYDFEALAIIEQLSNSGSSSAQWRYDQGIINERIGEVQMAQGDLGAALKSYQARHEIISRLAESDLGNAGWQRDLSVSYNKVGGVQEAQGDLNAALKSYSDSLAIREQLAKSAPGNASWQHDLVSSYVRIGDVQQAQGDVAAALKSYSGGLSVIERLAKSDPGNAEWQRDLSVSNERLGDIFLAQGNLSAAKEQYRASLDRMVPLRDRDPSNADLQRFTSVTMRLLANVYRQKDDKATARDYLRQGQAIMQRLTKLSPDNAVWKKDLARFDGEIAELDRETAEVRPSPHRPKRR
jgi:tetratricopeptide (TPR) repeat protein/pimeloyl-ACP methyl ester carboxylesterase